MRREVATVKPKQQHCMLQQPSVCRIPLFHPPVPQHSALVTRTMKSALLQSCERGMRGSVGCTTPGKTTRHSCPYHKGCQSQTATLLFHKLCTSCGNAPLALCCAARCATICQLIRPAAVHSQHQPHVEEAATGTDVSVVHGYLC